MTAQSDCIFCRIVDGEIPSHTVYEDDAVMAFLDANPLARGHTLIIPKAHHPTTDGLPEAVGAAIGRSIARLTPAVERAVDADASTIGINNGEAAGQEVDHMHAHVIPRTEGDGGGTIHSVMGASMGDGTAADDDDLAEIAEDIADEL